MSKSTKLAFQNKNGVNSLTLQKDLRKLSPCTFEDPIRKVEATKSLTKTREDDNSIYRHYKRDHLQRPSFSSCSGCETDSRAFFPALSHPGKLPRFKKICGQFFKSPESFRAYFGCHNSLYIFAKPSFQAIKLRNPLSFSYIKNMLKDQLFKISRLQLDD